MGPTGEALERQCTSRIRRREETTRYGLDSAPSLPICFTQLSTQKLSRDFGRIGSFAAAGCSCPGRRPCGRGRPSGIRFSVLEGAGLAWNSQESGLK